MEKTKENLRKIFDEIDTDKSGALDPEEIKKLAIEMGDPLSQEEIDKVKTFFIYK